MPQISATDNSRMASGVRKLYLDVVVEKGVLRCSVCSTVIFAVTRSCTLLGTLLHNGLCKGPQQLLDGGVQIQPALVVGLHGLQAMGKLTDSIGRREKTMGETAH